MKCPRCQHENSAATKFCGECGTRLAAICSACGASNPSTNRFCGDCGLPLGANPATAALASPRSYTPPHLAEKILAGKSALEGERKQVTVLFADLVSSTALADRVGAEAMHALLSRFFELALAEVHRYEGTINQFLGDGFMALFGAPVAHEDHAQRAVLAAWAIQRQVRERGLGLEVRIGLNTGPVVVGTIGDNLRMDYTAVGDTTNVAARIQQLAEPGAVLVGEATHRLVSAYVRAEALEPSDVKGKRAPITAYRLLGPGPRRSPLEARGERALSRFIGRERELTALRDLLRHAERGQGQVVGIAGEAGLGKSRLLHEFRMILADLNLTYLEGRCLSYGAGVPYLPILDVVRNKCGIRDDDASEAIADKLRLDLHEAGMDAADGAPYLLHLLGVRDGTDALARLSPEAVKARTFEILRQCILRNSRRRPLVLAVEDLHWIDRASEEYLASLAEDLAGAPLLLVATYRPGYQPGWLGRSYATQIALRPLSPDDDLTQFRSAFRLEQVPESLARIILKKAEGNPFFLEELTRAVAEHGGPDATFAVPDTVQGVLMARIDRLPAGSKRLLQTASVLGRQSPAKLLEALWDEPETLSTYLTELRRLEFLYDETRDHEAVYLFKHVLTQEVAYESLLTPRRQALHAAAGQALERLYADRLEQVYDRLAYHYARTTDAHKAVEYLTRLAEAAARSFAHAEAVTALREALSHVEGLPADVRDRHRLDLLVRQSDSLHFLGRRREIVDLLLAERGTLDRIADPVLAGPYHLGLAVAHSFLGERRPAGENAHLALEEATRAGDRVTAGKALTILTLEGRFSGRYQEAIAHGEQAVAFLEGTAELSSLSWAYVHLAASRMAIGDFEQAVESLARADALGETAGSRRMRTNAVFHHGWTLVSSGDAEAAIEEYQRAVGLAPDQFEAAMVQGFLGQAYVVKGDVKEALRLLEPAVEQAQQFRSRQMQSWFKAFTADAYGLDDQIERGRELAVDALRLAREIESPPSIACAQRILGRITMAAGDLSEAEEHLRAALEVFTSIGAKPEGAWTQLDLTAVCQAQGKRQAAKQHLQAAHSLCRERGWSKLADRAERLARELGIRLG